MGALTLDASALVGLLDDRDPHHGDAVRSAAAAEARGDALLAPASAIGEALVAPARAGRSHEAHADLEAMGVAVVPLTAAIAVRATELRAEHARLRLPDALVLATAEHVGADLLTYDERLRRLAP